MARTKPKKSKSRRFFSEEFKREAVQMLLDGHSPPPSPNDWDSPDPMRSTAGSAKLCARQAQRLAHLGNAYTRSKRGLRRVERERDILKELRQENLGRGEAS